MKKNEKQKNRAHLDNDNHIDFTNGTIDLSSLLHLEGCEGTLLSAVQRRDSRESAENTDVRA